MLILYGILVVICNIYHNDLGMQFKCSAESHSTFCTEAVLLIGIRGIYLIKSILTVPGKMSGAFETPASKKWSCATLGEGLNEVLAQSYPDGEEADLLKQLQDTMLIVLVSCQVFATQMPIIKQSLFDVDRKLIFHASLFFIMMTSFPGKELDEKIQGSGGSSPTSAWFPDTPNTCFINSINFGAHPMKSRIQAAPETPTPLSETIPAKTLGE